MTWLPTFDTSSLAYVGVFVGVLLAFSGIYQILTRSETLSETRNRRMKMIAAGATTEEMLRLLKPTADEWSLKHVPFIGTIPSDLRRAGLTATPSVFLMVMIGAFAVITLAASTMISASSAALVGLIVSILAPITWLRFLRNKRMDTLVRQLPDALDLMSRGLRVGHPLNTTIAAVAKDMRDPIATEFGVMVDQVSFGDDLVDAVMDFAERTELEDARYLAVSVAIQHGTGGNLADVLSTLSKVIRDRMSMRKRIKAISAEGRLTSYFLSFLPFLIFGAMSATSPDYYIGVMDNPMFRPMAIVVVGLVIANFVVMQRLVNFRI
ncbi:type II secretion system F family protein [Defluviimonas aestuarii]|uniref:type II secretion system F family protein n=1 Tax=Albidovulum aestuarii TaxID=1130726 RepID=UPI00249BBAA3|nr:type II secretion system F family protein [Defluviimonas aestuarii]MDI3334889.1 type II secretion system F family protein [Defluviimonas aestuarii]